LLIRAVAQDEETARTNGRSISLHVLVLSRFGSGLAAFAGDERTLLYEINGIGLYLGVIGFPPQS